MATLSRETIRAICRPPKRFGVTHIVVGPTRIPYEGRPSSSREFDTFKRKCELLK